MPDQIRVAIIGGSMSGCALALGLQQQQHLHPHIQYDVFEAWSFTERGAGVGVHPNGMNALRALGLDADGIMEAAGAFRETAAEAIVAYGEHEGTELFRVGGGIHNVLRTTLLEEMLKLLPEERLHADKKLISVDEGESMVLRFQDGSVFEADAVVGCDGFRSTVRGFVLGKDHAAVPPRFTGYWDARAFMTAEDTQTAWGDEIVQHDNPREYFKTGEGCCLLFACAPKGKFGGVVAAGVAQAQDWDLIDSSKKALTREFLEKQFGGWNKPYVQAVIDCLLDPANGPGVLFAEYESQLAPTWCRDRLCIIGDAAHAALPWLGQGFSMAAEDAAVLNALLGTVQQKKDVPAAFRAFDKIRRGPDSRPEAVIKNGAIMASLCAGQMGLDPTGSAQKASEDMKAVFSYLWEGDINMEIQNALRAFEELN